MTTGYRTLFCLGALLFGLLVQGPAYANPNDYDPVSGEPKCFKCHTPDRRYSIDYSRDDTCVECHGPGLSEKYLEINARHRVPKSDLGFWEKPSRRPKDKAAGDFATKPYSTRTVRSKIAENAVFRDALTISNPAKAGLGRVVEAKNERTDVKSDAGPAGPAGSEARAGAPEDMAYVAAGEFTMGSNDWWPKSQPEHKRTLKAFYIDKYEVTNSKYKAFVNATGHRLPPNWEGGNIPKGKKEHPVTLVSWHDADKFCKWEGKRLPAEAEWEKAARGTDKRTFPWGDKFSKFKGNTPQLGKEDTMPVGSFDNGKSPYGVYDMAGNVFEWVDSWFRQYPGNTHPDENYGTRYKSIRGGSWYDCTYYKCGISAPTYNRIFFHPGTRNETFGFRCAKDE